MGRSGGPTAKAAPAPKASPAPKQVATTYYVVPEFKMPEDTTETTHEQALGQTRTWKWNGDESLLPTWALRRLTSHQLQLLKNANDATGLAFNVEEVVKEYNVVTVGEVDNASMAITIIVAVPLVTNPRKILKGKELILECAKTTAPIETRKRPEADWKKDALRSQRQKNET